MKRTLSPAAMATFLSAIEERELELTMMARRLNAADKIEDAKVCYRVRDELSCLLVEVAKTIRAAGLDAPGAAVAFYSLSLEVSPSSGTTPEPSRSSSSSSSSVFYPEGFLEQEAAKVRPLYQPKK